MAEPRGPVEKERSSNFQAVRVPFGDCHCVMANLGISNLVFDDYADMDTGKQFDGTYKFKELFSRSKKDTEEVDAKRAIPLTVAKELGHIE
jgi:hypothetical protein